MQRGYYRRVVYSPPFWRIICLQQPHLSRPISGERRRPFSAELWSHHHVCPVFVSAWREADSHLRNELSGNKTAGTWAACWHLLPRSLVCIVPLFVLLLLLIYLSIYHSFLRGQQNTSCQSWPQTTWWLFTPHSALSGEPSVSLGFTAPLACGSQSFHIYNFTCGIAPVFFLLWAFTLDLSPGKPPSSKLLI